MGTCVLVIGKSGSGKSTSLRNFDKGEVGIFNVLGKPLPFRKKLDMCDKPNYAKAIATLCANNMRAYVIDDSTYFMQLENFARADESGYKKYTDMAVNFERLMEAAMATDEDTIVYFMHHPQFSDDGSQRPQTVGKMIDNQLCMEGLFPIVLESAVVEGRHVFVTKNNGMNIAKAPMGMFDEDAIDNDLKAVDSIIRDYWGMAPIVDPPATTEGESGEAE